MYFQPVKKVPQRSFDRGEKPPTQKTVTEAKIFVLTRDKNKKALSQTKTQARLITDPDGNRCCIVKRNSGTFKCQRVGLWAVLCGSGPFYMSQDWITHNMTSRCPLSSQRYAGYTHHEVVPRKSKLVNPFFWPSLIFTTTCCLLFTHRIIHHLSICWTQSAHKTQHEQHSRAFFHQPNTV